MLHQLVTRSPDCLRLGHRIDHRVRPGGTGKLEFCAVCTLGYEMALTAFDGDEARADDFVRTLRAEP